jgi:hypothetical protein
MDGVQVLPWNSFLSGSDQGGWNHVSEWIAQASPRAGLHDDDIVAL